MEYASAFSDGFVVHKASIAFYYSVLKAFHKRVKTHVWQCVPLVN